MALDLEKVGKKLSPITYEYGTKEVILYALGVGAGAEPDELGFVYEGVDLKVLPTFAVVPSFPSLFGTVDALGADPLFILHGEQRIEIERPIPISGKVVTTPTLAAVYDKTKGALSITETETVDENGQLLFRNVFSLFIRGEGGFGGERGPSGAKNVPPDRPPDHTIEMKTHETQALLYRIPSGDGNPLHADPAVAKMAGYDRPILHGLCTMGFAGRAVLRACAGNDPARFRSLETRFSGIVYPGETLVTEIWNVEKGKAIIRSKTAEREGPVIDRAAATWDP